LCDFNDDGRVTFADLRLILHAYQNKIYVWEYDLNQDGVIDWTNLRIGRVYLRQPAQWIVLDTFVSDDGSYIYAQAWDFSGWGIRR
jgi:hypothetical protein